MSPEEVATSPLQISKQGEPRTTDKHCAWSAKLETNAKLFQNFARIIAKPEGTIGQYNRRAGELWRTPSMKARSILLEGTHPVGLLYT